jgi:hypothetical protein
MPKLHGITADWSAQIVWPPENTGPLQRTVFMEGTGAMQPANAELRKTEIGAQFVSFNFTNALIWVAGSSAGPACERSQSRRRHRR